jgi:protein ImuB
MRCSNLVLVAHSAQRDRAVFDRVIIGLQDTVPHHTLLSPGMLAFGARGLSRFYGDEDLAARALRDAVSTPERPVDVRIGVADDLFSAMMAATHTEPVRPVRRIDPGASGAFLAGLPIEVLDDSYVVSLLTRLGVSTLGQCAALGEDALRQRFGAVGEKIYRLASGLDHSVVSPQDAPLDVSQLVELPDAHHVVDHVAFSIRVATEDYVNRLSAAGVVCTRVRITVGFDNAQHGTRVWLHPRFFSASELVDRVRWQLEQQARDDPQQHETPPGVVSVFYEALSPEERDSHEPGLWGQGPDARVHHVFSRVQSLVGAGGVLTARTQTSRFPGATHVLTTWGEKVVPSQHQGPMPGALPKPFPGTVFSHPRDVLLYDSAGQHITVENATLSHAPARLVLGQRELVLVSWAGPWPVSERWWDERHARYAHRVQVLDERGVGWLLTSAQGTLWRLEARYD